MNDEARWQGGLEHTRASVRRLRALDRALRNAADGIRVSTVDQNTRSLLAQHLRRRVHPDFDHLFVDADYEVFARELIASIEASVVDVARCFDQPWWRGGTAGHREEDDGAGREVWTLGTVEFLVEERSILRGDIELCKTEPIAPDLPNVVVEYLVTVPGTRDQLARERHGHWGYHYHYLDSRNRRSDTLLTFDRKSLANNTPRLWWERHAESQKFKARASMWGTDKRESVYSVCRPDTLRFGLADFKRPASDAEVVWPLSAEVLATIARPDAQ